MVRHARHLDRGRGGRLGAVGHPLVRRRERRAHDVLLRTVVDAAAQLREVGDHARLVPLPAGVDAVVERALIGVRGSGHLPRADELRVGLLRGEEAEPEQVGLRLEHHHGHAQIGANVHHLRCPTVGTRVEIRARSAAAVDHEAVVDVRARRDRVHVRDEARRRLRLAVGDQVTRLQRPERARAVGVQQRLRGLREDVVREVVAGMVETLVALRVLVDQALGVVAGDRDLRAARHADGLRGHGRRRRTRHAAAARPRSRSRDRRRGPRSC